MQPHIYDVVVIGAGSGGLTAAVGLSRAGKKVLLVEREKMGGECTNTGCVPSKALLHHAKAFYEAQSITGQTQQGETYRRNAFNYVRSVIADVLKDETAEHFVSQGIDVVIGEAEFTKKHTVVVAGITYGFKKAVIATGSSPRPLAIPGLDDTNVLTNQNLFELSDIPERTLIVGAGPIGMEMGQALAMLGSYVTIIDNGPRLAKLEDEAISPIIANVFTRLGITVLHNAAVTKAEGNAVHVSLKDDSQHTTSSITVTFDKVLIAVGRTPNFPTGLKAAGIESTDQGIVVNTNWQTTNKNIYALGDVAARLKFTHVADDTARQVVAHLVSKGLLSVKPKQVPKVTYTDPEMAQVGMSWNEAIQTYTEQNIVRIEVPLSTNDRARTDNATAGLLIIIAKRLTGTILGAHMIGPRAGELIGTLTLAMENNISLYRLRSTIFAYPTYSLVLKKAGDYFLATQFTNLRIDLFNLGKSVAPKFIVALLWLLLLFTLYTYQQTFGLTAGELSLKLFSVITTSTAAPLLYILAYTIRPITFFPGTALTILSGVFFGLWGILYTIIGANLSAALAYFIGRFFSREKSARATSLLGRFADTCQQNPFMSILTMRLTFMPFDVVNYGAGLLKLPFLPYLGATALGTLLGIATFVSIGAAISVEEFVKNGITTDAIDSTFILLSALIFTASFGISKLLKRK